MFQTIESYIEDKFEVLNQTAAEGFSVQRITNDFQYENISASQADINYQLFISNFEYDTELETPGMFSVNVRLDFLFIVAGKNYTVYKDKFDSYLYPLAALFVNDSRGLNFTSEDNSAITINELTQIAITNSDRFEENYYRPSIEMTLRGYANWYSNEISSTANVTT